MEAKREQFTEAYDTWSEALFRHCYFRVYDRERAKELMQETFVKTWEYLRGNDIDNLRAFLYRVANNLIIDEARKRRLTVSVEDLAEQGWEVPDAAEQAIIQNVEGRELREILEQLEAADRDILILRYLDGFPPREIAVILGETENVVSVRIYRALKKAQRLANPSPPSPSQGEEKI